MVFEPFKRTENLNRLGKERWRLGYQFNNLVDHGCSYKGRGIGSVRTADDNARCGGRALEVEGVVDI